jgi:RNA polymerase sigma-70 factor (ECF subfamily)
MEMASEADDFEMTDESLAQQAAGGDRACFEALVERYRDSVYRICLRCADHAADAEDWAQECFVRVFRQLPTYDCSRPFAPWFRRVVANVCINMARGRKRAYAGVSIGLDEMDEPVSGPSTDPQSVFLTKEAKQAVLQAISHLEPTLQQAVILRVVEGLSFKEMAEALQVPLPTASTWVRRALLRVRETLVQQGMEMG